MLHISIRLTKKKQLDVTVKPNAMKFSRVHGSAYALPTFEFKCQCHLSSRCRAARELCGVPYLRKSIIRVAKTARLFWQNKTFETGKILFIIYRFKC